MDKVVAYYDEIAETYDQSRFDNTYGQYIDKQERKVLDQLLNNSTEKIVDLACGSGRLLNYATISVDASEKMVALAKQKHPEKQVIHAPAHATGIADNSIDTIISFHFFMHLKDEQIDQILQECHRILKPNGRLIFDIPSKKRRSLLKYQSNEWHGANSKSMKELKQLSDFKMTRSFGILFFPIHRFPKSLRRFLIKLDALMARSFLKEYSSYLILEMKKQ